MHNHILYKLRKDLLAADALWQKRRRKINTTCIFNDLCNAAIKKRGLRHNLHKSESEYTPEALGQARHKLPAGIFAQINKSIQDKEYRNTGNASRVFAIDGSKVHVHPIFQKYGYTSRTNNQPVSRPAVRPLAMLSSMLDVHSKCCYDAQITSHFNERKSVLAHMKVAKPGDTLLFDRGYYSNQLLRSASTHGLKVLFRLKKTAFKAAATFWNSTRNQIMTRVYHPDSTFTEVMLVKYFIDGKKYMNLINFCTSIPKIRDLYALRWRVETSFKRLKSYLNLEDSHSMSPQLYTQEVEARLLLDTITQQTKDVHDLDASTKLLNKTNVVSYLRILDQVAQLLFVMKTAAMNRLSTRQCNVLINKYFPP